jgi:hypothetical protein
LPNPPQQFSFALKENKPIYHEPRKRMLGHVDRWNSSGMAQRDYCTQEGIDYNQFHYWYRVYKGKAKKKKAVTPGFVPILLTEDINEGSHKPFVSKASIRSLHLSQLWMLLSH